MLGFLGVSFSRLTIGYIFSFFFTFLFEYSAALGTEGKRSAL